MNQLPYRCAVIKWFKDKYYFFPFFLLSQKGGGGPGFPPVECFDDLGDAQIGKSIIQTFKKTKIASFRNYCFEGSKPPNEWFSTSLEDYEKHVLEIWVFHKDNQIAFEMIPKWGQQARQETKDLIPYTLPANATNEEIGKTAKLALASLYPGKNPFQKKYFPDLYKKDVPEGGGPMAFGEGLGWVAVRAKAPREVMAAFKPVKEFKSTPWENAIQTFDGEMEALNQVFVTPPIQGWVLLVSPWFGGGELAERRMDQTLMAFSEKFGKAAGFVCCEKYDWFYWARAQKGEITRLVESFEGLRTKGKPTREEKELLDYASSPQNEWTPSAEDVFKLAGAWSLNPMDFAPGHPIPVGPGWMGQCKPPPVK